MFRRFQSRIISTSVGAQASSASLVAPTTSLLVCPSRGAISTYSQWIKEHCRDKKYEGLSIPERGRRFSKDYHSVPKKDMAGLKERAQKSSYRHTPFDGKVVAESLPGGAGGKSKKLPAYQQFVKVAMASKQIKGIPDQRGRLKAIAAAWQNRRATA